MNITVAGLATGNMRHLIVDGVTACGRSADEVRSLTSGEWGGRDADGRQIVFNCRHCEREARRNPRSLGLA